MVDDQLVAICWPVCAGHLWIAGGTGMLQNLAQNHVLHFASQHAAAHQPGVDLPDSILQQAGR